MKSAVTKSTDETIRNIIWDLFELSNPDDYNKVKLIISELIKINSRNIKSAERRANNIKSMLKTLSFHDLVGVFFYIKDEASKYRQKENVPDFFLSGGRRGRKMKQENRETLYSVFSDLGRYTYELCLNLLHSGNVAYDADLIDFYHAALFSDLLEEIDFDAILENLSFFKEDIPESQEPANHFKQYAEFLLEWSNLQPYILYDMAIFSIQTKRFRHAESILRYLYLYDKELNDGFKGYSYSEIIELLIYVNIMLGKYSQAIRYLEELKDLYLREEISWEYYAEVLTKYGSQIVQEDIKSISIDFNLIYELYNELKNLRDENRKLSETLSEYQSPETILKNFFGIFWDNLGEISKQNLIKAKKSEILLKENNEVFRDIILGYYDAVACEIQKLNQKVESTIPNIDINQPERIDNPFKKFETLISSNIKEVKDLLNKETIGGSKIIKLQYFDYVRPLSYLRNKLAHQNAKIVSQDEIDEFLTNKLHGILKFIISIQPRNP